MHDEPLWLTEADVVRVVDLPSAIQSVRETLSEQDRAEAMLLAKTSVRWDGGHTLHALGGVLQSPHVAGVKAWAHTSQGANPLLLLWDAESGGLLAVVGAFALGQMRTAAVSAIATDLLAPRGRARMAMPGTGRQAMAQVAAVAAVRKLDEVRVFSPTSGHREVFAAKLGHANLCDRVLAAASISEAVDGASIITTATRASAPILRSDDLGSNVHVNAIGSISPERIELAPDIAAEADIVVSDSPDAALSLSRELAEAREVIALHRAANGDVPIETGGRTLFKAMGLGLADVGLGCRVVARAQESGLGTPLNRESVPTLTWNGDAR